MSINVPNQITIGRLLMSIVFFACLAQYDAKNAAGRTWLLDISAYIFLLAALSDIVDGYLARKHNQITSFGRVIDPFVDKILTIGAYTFLASDGFVDPSGEKITGVTAWMVVVILARELLVTSLRGMTEAQGSSFAANAYGKAKMALQSTTVVWLLLTLAHPEGLAFFKQFNTFLVYLTVIVTFLSMVPYLWSARGILAQTSVSPS
jgi:CDP-diacylglycerol--glycerol-3-phosphate 3-phosphatidyltransferase